MKRLIGILASFVFLICIAVAPRAAAQGIIQTGTGLGVQKVKLAVPNFASRNPQAGALEGVFHQVLMDDLSYSGIIDMVSPSFYPVNAPSVPGELNAEQWSQAPANAWMIAFGNLTVNGSSLSLAGYLYDVRQT
ncbi:MAG: translocation protein TolB, partial [Candidatus Acidiferrales bacterium]